MYLLFAISLSLIASCQWKRLLEWRREIPCEYAQYFQPLLQAKIYLNFVLRNSRFSVLRKVDKNTQRMVTKRNYYRCEKGCQSTSFSTILRSETSNEIPFYPKIRVKCVKRGTASTRIVSVVLALNILRIDFLVQVDTRFLYFHCLCK